MIFNFIYRAHDRFTLVSLADAVMPIYHGLSEAGHRVVGFGTKILPAPAINVLVEFFPDDGSIDELAAVKAQFGANVALGVLCTEDADDSHKMASPEWPRRRGNLLRLLPVVDFVWTLVPQVELYDKAAGPGKTALVKYGFTEHGCPQATIQNPALRDVDVVLYADLYEKDSPRHAAIVAGLKSRGLTCFVNVRSGAPGGSGYPSYVTDDLMRRAKVSLAIRSRAEVRFLCQATVAQSLHAGVAVLAEQYDASELGEFYRYTQACSYEAVIERCAEIIRSRTYVDLGMAALSRFRAETSMRDNMIEALRLPAFDRLRS